MKFRIIVGFIVCLLIMGLVKPASSEPVARFMDWLVPVENLELAGFFKNEIAGGFAEEHDQLMKFRNTVDLKGNYKINDYMEFYTNVDFWYDSVYDIEGNYRELVYGEDRTKLEMPEDKQILKECFLDIFTPKVDLRLGKQYVVWGTTDGVRILDLVNPIDMREWTLKDFSDLRLGLWMLKAEGEIMMNGHLQLLLIPDYEPNYYPPAGAPFALRTSILGAQAAAMPFVTVTTIDSRPERTAENTKIGLRWRNVIETGMFSGLEYTLNYLNTNDFASSAYTATAVTFAGPGLPPSIQVKLARRSERIQVFGGSFAKSITKGIVGDFAKGWTIRGEFAYIKGGAMNYGTDASIKDTVDVDQYNYALGFDKTFLTNWLFSTQFIQLITDTAEGMSDFDDNKYTLLFGPTRGPLDKVESLITLKISTDFMHERLKPEVLVIYGDDDDWRISPKVSFEVNDNLTLATGVHIFEGDPQQMHGQFDDSDQVFFETKYSW